MAKPQPQHRDLLNRPLALGDTVAYSQYNQLYLGTVSKISSVKIRVERMITHRTWAETIASSQYPQDLVKVPKDAELTQWVLKGAKTGWEQRQGDQ